MWFRRQGKNERNIGWLKQKWGKLMDAHEALIAGLRAQRKRVCQAVVCSGKGRSAETVGWRRESLGSRVNNSAGANAALLRRFSDAVRGERGERYARRPKYVNGRAL